MTQYCINSKPINTHEEFINKISDLHLYGHIPNHPEFVLDCITDTGEYRYKNWYITITDTPKDSPQDTAQNPPTETSHRTTARGQAHTTRTHKATPAIIAAHREQQWNEVRKILALIDRIRCAPNLREYALLEHRLKKMDSTEELTYY